MRMPHPQYWAPQPQQGPEMHAHLPMVYKLQFTLTMLWL